jgi:hypothetical protein
MVTTPKTEVVDQEVMQIKMLAKTARDLNDEARMSNDEGMTKIQMTKSSFGEGCCFRAPSFGLDSSFVIRHSSFSINT